jgi:Rps23 Pro-64 3,4-dihydroxylase Tpa1-like proline 4-hydroxylase
MSILDTQSSTLPIQLEHGLFLDPKKAREFGEKLSGQYCFAEPYPHIVLDNFLPNQLAENILQNFPSEVLRGDKFFESDYYGLHKRQIFPVNCNDYIRNLFNFLNSSSVLQFLESLTQIKGLIPDPHFDGGGFHETSRGGKLGIHADFRINKQLHLNRRLNMIIYLNKDWEEDYGGCLEIWDKSMKNKIHSILPVFNKCVIFNTDATSYHGHPDPLNTPENITRKSIALYYYTASKSVYDETSDHSTMYVSRPGDNINIRKQVIKTKAREYLKDWLPPIFFRKLRQLKKSLPSKQIVAPE